MMRYILLGAFVLIVAFMGWQVFSLFSGRQNLDAVPAEYVMGTPDGDLTVVEFFDYSCIYCRQAHPTITQAVARDGHVRYIIRPVALLDENSMTAAAFLYAAGLQGKFAQMHEALMTGENPDKASVKNVAQRLGVDMERLERDAESEAVKEAIAQNAVIYRQMGAEGTPTFIIGRKMRYMPRDRMPTVGDFLNMFNEARNRGLK